MIYTMPKTVTVSDVRAVMRKLARKGVRLRHERMNEEERREYYSNLRRGKKVRKTA